MVEFIKVFWESKRCNIPTGRQEVLLEANDLSPDDRIGIEMAFMAETGHSADLMTGWDAENLYDEDGEVVSKIV